MGKGVYLERTEVSFLNGLRVREIGSAVGPGRRFGRLVIDGWQFRVGRHEWNVVATCDCGTVSCLSVSQIASGKCKSCGCIKSERARGLHVFNKHETAAEISRTGVKFCKGCDRPREVSEFSTRGNGRLRHQCKQCENRSRKEYSLKHPEKCREATNRWRRKNWERFKERQQEWRRENAKKLESYYLDHELKKYGMTSAEYFQLLENQNGVCAICGELNKGGKARLVVDHCHTTGAIRGLLCDGCNQGIGFLGDDAKSVLKAHEYLVHFESGQNVQCYIEYQI